MKYFRVLLTGISLVFFPVNGQVTESFIISTERDNADGFGKAFAKYKNEIIIGAASAKINGVQSGAAFILSKSGDRWQETFQFIPNDGTDFDSFGSSVAVNERFAFVGAPLTDDNGSQSGAVYVFERTDNRWIFQSKLLPHDGTIDHYFGATLSLADNRLAVGARSDTENGFNAGAVYLFKFSAGEWIEETKIIASDGSAGDGFGVSLALSENMLIIGANATDQNGSESGAAYVFEYTAGKWEQAAKLTPGDGAAGDKFGQSVSISGDIAIIGSLRADIGNHFDQGAAYIFFREHSKWSECVKLTADDGGEFDYFGNAVFVAHQRIIVGANRADIDGKLDQGAVYWFEQSGDIWLPKHKLISSDGTTSSEFGTVLEVAPEGDYIIVKGTAPSSPNNIYFYKLDDL